MLPKLGFDDVVTDEVSELEWRFRALCGLKNSLNNKIIAIGGPSAWAQPEGSVPDIAATAWGFEYHSIDFDEIGKLIRAAIADERAMERAKKRADAYLKIPGTRLETTDDFFVRSFVLDDLFRLLMREVGTNLITVNSCMGAIMPATETTACLTLSTLQDDGYLAFCESDFVVIPSGVLLGNITGKPVFFCNPNFPHRGIMTVAHCSAPRKMDGKTYDPVRIVTHMESDYGAAPHVEYPIGTMTTHLVPAFNGKRWIGFKGTICNVPFRQICRTQFDLRYEFPDSLLAERMPGFHWMTSFGDYRREVGYALRRVGIEWDNLDEVPTKTM
jgi:L-fucose isomerase-like protein